MINLLDCEDPLLNSPYVTVHDGIYGYQKHLYHVCLYQFSLSAQLKSHVILAKLSLGENRQVFSTRRYSIYTKVCLVNLYVHVAQAIYRPNAMKRLTDSELREILGDIDNQIASLPTQLRCYGPDISAQGGLIQLAVVTIEVCTCLISYLQRERVPRLTTGLLDGNSDLIFSELCQAQQKSTPAYHIQAFKLTLAGNRLQVALGDTLDGEQRQHHPRLLAACR